MIRMLLLVAAILMLVVGCEKPPVDASVSVLIVVGAGIIFLVTLGIRIRRVRALYAIHELRSIAHLIDMHQLNKDPERLPTQHTKGDEGSKSNATVLKIVTCAG